MLRKLFLVLGLVAAAACASSAADRATEKFVRQAIEGNLAEVDMGKLAQDKGANDGVRSFGRELVDDHSGANQKAISLANSIGVKAPTEPTKKQKAMYDRLAKLSGASFDRAFIKAMVEDHQKDIREYERQSKKGGDAAQYVNDTLPTLRKHLKDVEALRNSAARAPR